MSKTRISLVAASALAIAALFSACSSSSSSESNTTTATPTPTANMAFAKVAVPTTEAEKTSIGVSNKVTISGKDYALEFNTLAKTGDVGGTGNTEIFGLIKDVNEKAITIDGKNWICENGGANDNLGSGPDHTSLVTAPNGKLYMTTQFECAVGAMYSMEVSQDKTTGKLTAKKDTMKYIKISHENGSWVHCAGIKTPWESHLGSEEYEPNADLIDPTTGKALAADKKSVNAGDYYNNMYLYFNGDQTKANPYFYGWTPEVSYDANGASAFVKHYSMGRFAHELAYVMPDKKTSYLTDDGTNCILAMFVSDKESDLTSGTLYAAKWKQTSSTGSGAANIEWINLGHATDAEIKIYVNTKPKFSDIFDKEAKSTDGKTGSGSGVCSTGYTSVNTGHASANHECLKLKTGMEKYASRLETRRYAGMMGATTEFRKEEGVTYDSDRKKLYIAMSDISNGMLDNDSKADLGGNNDIKISKNSCGAVYQSDVASGIKDSKGTAINSSLVVTNMSGLVAGKSKTYTETEYKTNTCDLEGISSPDNITYLSGKNILVIGEDTSGHQNDMIWAYDLTTGTLTRIFTTPYGSETTSPFWYPNVNGFGYMTTVIQHPYGESDSDKAPNSAAKANYVGVIQGFPALDK